MKFEQLEGESWRDVVARFGKWAGVQQEVLEEYDWLDSNMNDKRMAAHIALYEWDALPICKL